MERVVCPHCGIHVTISGDSVSHTCPYCKGEFHLENESCEFSEFERELNLIDLSSTINNKTQMSNNVHTNDRKGSLSQQMVGERFKKEIGTIRLTKFSPLSLFISIFVFLYGHYIWLWLLLLGFSCLMLLIASPFIYAGLNSNDRIFFIFAIPIGILLGWWSLEAIKEDFRKFRRIHFFFHSSSNIVELTGRRKYGLGSHVVMYRTNLTTETIVEPITEITTYEGESGGTSYKYGLLFDDNKSNWTFYSSQRVLRSVLSEIESRCNVNVLPPRDIEF